MISVIVPAGGSGRRMKGRVPKIFLDLAGKPMLVRTLEVFRGIRGIGEIILALPPRRISRAIDRYGRRFRDLGVTKIAPGGASRQESVANALAVVESRADWVLVHDAARPLVTGREIRAVLRAARKTGAAILARPARDTLKQVDGRGRVVRTLDRTRIRHALTPQAFRAELLREAHRRRGGRPATDDAQLVERLGRKISVVEGSNWNLKVTTSEDLRMARRLFRDFSSIRSL